MKRTFLLALLLCATLLPAAAAARAPAMEGAPLLRRARLMHEGRQGVTPSVGISLAHPYSNHIMVGLRYDYYIANWIGLGADFGYAFGFDNGLAKRIKAERKQFETTTLGYSIMGGITLVPLHGKLLFKGLPSTRYDAFVRISGGAIQIRGDGDPIQSELAFAPRIGIGGHLFFGEQTAFVIEAHDTLVSMHRSTDSQGAVLAKQSTQLIGLQIGLLVHFPEKAEFGR
jgi:hypothetical protein